MEILYKELDAVLKSLKASKAASPDLILYKNITRKKLKKALRRIFDKVYKDKNT